MLYRHKDGTYTWSMPSPEDAQLSKHLSQEKGLDYIRSYPGIPNDIRQKLLNETSEGFIIT